MNARVMRAERQVLEAAVRYARTRRLRQFKDSALNELEQAAEVLERVHREPCETCGDYNCVETHVPAPRHHWLLVKCDYCGVEAGDYCRTSGDKMLRHPHMDRVEACRGMEAA